MGFFIRYEQQSYVSVNQFLGGSCLKRSNRGNLEEEKTMVGEPLPKKNGPKTRNPCLELQYRLDRTQEPRLMGKGVCPAYNARSCTTRARHDGTRAAARSS